MTFLLYHPRTRPSGRALAAALGIPCGTRMQRPHDRLIRWGSRRRTVADEPPTVLNSVSALACASDKLRTLTILREQGIRAPAATGERLIWSEAGPLLGRTRHGCGGEGIVMYQAGDELGEHEMYVQFIDAVREYRLHVFQGEVFRAQYKVATEGEFPIRNHKNGYRFRGVRSVRLNSDRTDAAVRAVAALGLDFGAVDMLIDREGRPWVLEVNTAPAMSPLTLSEYRRVISAWL